MSARTRILVTGLVCVACGDERMFAPPPAPARAPGSAPMPILRAPAGHEAATFELAPDGAFVWARAPRHDVVDVELIATGGEPRWIRGVPLEEDRGFTARLEVDGLTASTDYRYRLHFAAGGATGWYSFRTAPRPDDDAPLRFAFSADIGPNLEYYDVFERVGATRPSFFVSLGDWPYADKAPAADTLAKYRAKHAAARTIPRVRRFLQSTPLFSVWDDHDVIGNWDGASSAEFPERIEAGVRAWNEWFVARGPTHYRSWRWGRHVEFFALDTRRYRSSNKDVDGPDKTMLGAEQKRWLIDAVKRSDATFKLVVTSVPLDFGGGDDTWDVYRHERNEILRAWGEAGVRGLVFLSADRHWFAVHHHEWGAREYQVGPLAAGIKDPPKRRPVAAVARANRRNFGVISILPGDDPMLEFTGYDFEGRMLHTELVRPDVTWVSRLDRVTAAPSYVEEKPAPPPK